MSDPQTPDEPTPASTGAPPPPRGWRMGWFGKFVLVALMLVALVVVFWFLWLGGATNRRDAAWEKLRAAGIATSVEELTANIDPVPPAQNPAVEYMEAIALLDGQGEAWRAWNDFDIPEYARTPEEQAQFEQLQRAVVAAHGEALAKAAEADAKTRPAVEQVRGDFGVWSERNSSVPADMMSVDVPHLNGLRSLARLLAADAAVAAEEGDGERVLRNTVRIVGIADALDSDTHTLIEHLVAVGVRALASQAVIDHAATAAEGPEEFRREVIALLLYDTSQSAGYRTAMAGEATMQQSVMREMDTGRLAFSALGDPGAGGAPVSQSLLRPLMRDDAAQMAEHMLPMRDVIDHERLPEAQAALPDITWIEEMRLRDLFASMFLPSLDPAVETDYRARTDRRLAAAVLAIRSYQQDHDGQLPPDLAALVPQYLPAVPIDPMAADGNLQYDPARGLLWSVGPDSQDDGGDASPSEGRNRGRWSWEDAVIPLTPEAREALRTAPDSQEPGLGES